MADTPAPADALAALRASDVPAREPVRWRLAEALARRASAHSGASRRAIDDKLAALVATLSTPREAPARIEPASPRRGALAELAAHAARQKAIAPSGAAAKGSAAQDATGTATDARTVQFFKRTWSRLSADQRLAQSRAALPENAGPLNSQHLVHRALTLMHDLSPEYLERFVGYVDALQWLEQADEAAAQEAASRAGGARRSMPARR